MNQQTQTLSQLTGRKTIANPADLLPKKEVELRDTMTDVLGDLGLVIKRESEETEKIARAMMEDMKHAKEMGLEPQFRNDELATEGMQPMQINYDMHSTEGFDSNIPENGPIKLRPSEFLEESGITSITNYITPPIYTNSCNIFTDPVKFIDVKTTEGPRSVMVDNDEIDVDKILEERKNTKHNQINKSKNESSEGVDPDDDSDILALLEKEFEE